MATRQELWKQIKDIIPCPRDRKSMNIRYGSRVYLIEALSNLSRDQVRPVTEIPESVVEELDTEIPEVQNNKILLYRGIVNLHPSISHSPPLGARANSSAKPTRPKGEREGSHIPAEPKAEPTAPGSFAPKSQPRQETWIQINPSVDNLKLFLRSHKYDKNNEFVCTHTSLLKGSYHISSENTKTLHNLLASSYQFSFKNPNANYYLSEIAPKIPGRNFKFFLDIDSSTDKKFEITDDVINFTLYNYLQSILQDMTDINIDLKFPLISRNTKYPNKVHIVFSDICVDKVTYKVIIDALYKTIQDKRLSVTIDLNCISGLRMLGAKKVSEDEEDKGWYIPIKNYGGETGGFIINHPRKGSFLQRFRDYVNPANLKLFSIRDIEGCTNLKLNKNYHPRKQSSNYDVFCKYVFPDTEEIIEQTTVLVKKLSVFRSKENKYWFSIVNVINSLSEGEEWGYELYKEFSDLSPDHQGITDDQRLKLWEALDFNKTKLESWNILVSCVKKDTGILPEFIKSRETPEKKEVFDKILSDDWSLPQNEIISGKGDYVDPEIFNSYEKCILTVASLGRGKTYSIKKWIIDNIQKYPRILWLSNRISFSDTFMEDKSFIESTGFVNYQSIRSDVILNDRLIIQYESLHRTDLQLYDLVICDEIESLLTQVSSRKTNSVFFDTNFSTLTFLFKNCKKLLLADAFLSKRTLSFVQGLNVNYKIYSWEKPREVRRSIEYKSEIVLLNSIIENLTLGKKSFFFSSSKRQLLLKYIPYIIEKIGNEIFDKECLVYTSDSPGKVKVEDWDKKTLIITTSKITVGLSCDQTFSDVFCIAKNSSGVLVRDICQALYRVRSISNAAHFFIDSKTVNFCKRLPFEYNSVKSFLSNLSSLKKEIINEYMLETRLDCRQTTLFELLTYNICEKSFNSVFFKEAMTFYLSKSGYVFKQPDDSIVDIKLIPSLGISYDFWTIPEISQQQAIDLQKKGRIEKLNDSEISSLYKYRFCRDINVEKLCKDFQTIQTDFKDTINKLFDKFVSGGLSENISNFKTMNLSLDTMLDREKTKYIVNLTDNVVHKKILYLLENLLGSSLQSLSENGKEISLTTFEDMKWKEISKLLSSIKRRVYTDQDILNEKLRQDKYKKHKGEIKVKKFEAEKRTLENYLLSTLFKISLGKRRGKGGSKRDNFQIKPRFEVYGKSLLKYVKITNPVQDFSGTAELKL